MTTSQSTSPRGASVQPWAVGLVGVVVILLLLVGLTF